MGDQETEGQVRQAGNFDPYLRTSASLKLVFGGVAGFQRCRATAASDKGEPSKLHSGGPHMHQQRSSAAICCVGLPHTIPFKQRAHLL